MLMLNICQSTKWYFCNATCRSSVWPKCTLEASYAALDRTRWVCRRVRQMDKRTDGLMPDHYVTLFTTSDLH